MTQGWQGHSHLSPTLGLALKKQSHILTHSHRDRDALMTFSSNSWIPNLQHLGWHMHCVSTVWIIMCFVSP